MKKQFHIFLTALMFYSRIPCPKTIDHHAEDLNKASRYFPLIGWIVGGISCLAYLLAESLFTTEIAVLLSMVVSVWTTGAFHEDGFADVCDGFGGGWTKEKILSIMKDSAIGAYGAIGIVLLLGLKFVSLKSLLPDSRVPVWLLFVTAHALSRFAAISIVFTHPYSREDTTSKSKPIALHYSWREVVGASLFGLLPLGLMACYQWQSIGLLLPVIALRLYLARYFQKWIDGYTGDCLGATQQLTELVFYLSVIALWKFI